MNYIDNLRAKIYVINSELETCSAEIVRLEQIIDDYIIERGNIFNENLNSADLENLELAINLKIDRCKLEIASLSRKSINLVKERENNLDQIDCLEAAGIVM